MTQPADPVKMERKLTCGQHTMKHDEEWADLPEDEDALTQAEDEEALSKSAIKREAERLKQLGSALVGLSASTLERFPLDDTLRDAILLAQRLKREGRRRQIQLIGKLLRARDPAPIQQALDRLQNKHNQQTAQLHKLESLRDQLLRDGAGAIDSVLKHYPHADRQRLRTLARLAQKEKAAEQPPKHARQLFQYLRELDETAQ